MASSDDEGEAVPHTISNYYFVDENDEPVAFSVLPIQWREGEELDRVRKQIFLHGTADNGLQKLYKQVIAWKFDIADLRPEIFVLSKESAWIKLQKPRKSFEDLIRSILITVHCLHFMRKNPEAPGRSLWDHLSRIFSSHEIMPSENDLVDHTSLISEALERDETLAKSKYLVTFLEEKPKKKKASNEDTGTMSAGRFIVDDEIIDEVEEDDGSDDEQDLFDSVCSICDNGGELLSCEGSCMRSFHPTVEAGSESACDSLGFSAEEVEAMPNFFCLNCQHKQHQCFACGKLGSSDKLSGTEVFKCVTATCGHFYHPHCVAKLLNRDNAAAAEEFQKKVAAGETFSCPIHKCFACQQGEDKTNPDLQFAVCRRCPKSYHRKCLPREIAFEDMEDEEILQRAWEDLIPNRILIYCLNHEIDEELGTPVRNHIKFPGNEPKRRNLEPQLLSQEKVLPKKRSLSSEDDLRKGTVVKVQKGDKFPSFVKESNSSKKIVRRLAGSDSVKKPKGADRSKMQSGDSCLGAMLHNFMSKGSKDFVEKEHREKVIEKPAVSSLVQLDDDSKQRIIALVKDATSSVTLEDIIEMRRLPKTHIGSMKQIVDKTITLGRVEGSVEAVRAALQKLEEGGSVEDAKAVCEPGVLHQIVKWKNKLKVYLAPFLHGMRYTSFGRHFTKVDKLKEIVNVLYPYIQDGDMVVDFCCGANDFSWLMKMKLDEIGKKCSYKNYDIMQAKNDFNFEKRDWMSVKTNELPAGSQLIMGLNPPFGVNAILANKFIDKALEFKPKLLILIVPKETERLDIKKNPYDLIWEDDELLAGKSFYLPGSIDVNDNQLEDWNVSTPPLYLWSRPDWTAKYVAIAKQHGHLSRVRELSHQDEELGRNKLLAPDLPLEDDNLNGISFTPVRDHPVQKEAQVVGPETLVPCMAEKGDASGVPPDDSKKELDVHQSWWKDQAEEPSKKRVHDKEERVRGSGMKTPERSKEREQQPGGSGGKGLQKSKKRVRRKGKKFRLGPPSEREFSSERDRHCGPRLAGTDSHPRTGYLVTRREENERRYGLNSEESHSGVAHRWSVGAGPGPGPGPGLGLDYGMRNPEEHFASHRRESIDSHSNRPTSYAGELNEQYASSSALRSRVGGLYGQTDPLSLSQRSSFMLSGLDSVYPSQYSGHMGSQTDPRMSTSTMQRYAPRLDELNHTRAYGQIAAARGPSTVPSQQPGYLAGSLGFALDPYRPSQQNSSGWLND